VIEASEAEDKLEKAADALLHDPLLLDRIETRLFDLRAAGRKHGCTVDELPQRMLAMRAALDGIEGGEVAIAKLTRAARGCRVGLPGQGRRAFRGPRRGRQATRCGCGGGTAPLELDAARFRTQR